MNWSGGILVAIGQMLYRKHRRETILEKLKSGKSDENEWIYGDIPTQCDSCGIKIFNHGLSITLADGKGIIKLDATVPCPDSICYSFITGWDESIFKILCPYCYEKFGGDLRDVKVYNTETLRVTKDDDTPEKREKSRKLKRWLGWG